MADIEIRARAFWTDVEGDSLAVGFAASEDPEDGYVVFEGRPGDRKGLYLEVSDEIFAAKDAVEAVTFTEAGFVVAIRPAMMAKLGMVGEVAVFVDAGDADGHAALAVLRQVLGPTAA
ncbi:hypothetical protein [Paragemmobacter ruber]|uniref:Uncharacterized protein n=1 Tax=Paragemmobacter ruber TaxID=1985673 RepID=A0ABW9Y318_9RHOB|nr:hypothetical protein [Rhodobacter ruber]NBE06900.1 hypothetical protein [Rhodobacter ruber]